MSIQKKLDQALAHSIVMEIPDSFKGLFISDIHMGVGDEADDFRPNYWTCIKLVKRSLAEGFRIFLLGDGYELWENPGYKDIWHAYPELCGLLGDRAVRLSGNHDQELMLPQSYVLLNKKTERRILILHGHQGNFFCDEGYPLGRFFVRYIWRNLQLIGFKDPTTAQSDKNPKKHEATREAFHEWALSRKQTVIFGHTHFAECDPPYYWNCGSWVGDGGHVVKVIGDQISLETFKPKEA